MAVLALIVCDGTTYPEMVSQVRAAQVLEHLRLETLDVIKVAGRSVVDVSYKEVTVYEPLPEEALGLPSDIEAPPPPRREAAPNASSSPSPKVEES